MAGDRFEILCLHRELLPSGGSVPVPHSLEGEVPATQNILIVASAAAARQGDVWSDNTSADHRCAKTGCAFETPPSSTAEITEAGQSILHVDGKAVAVRAGRIDCCCEVQSERSLNQIIISGGAPRLFVNGQAVVLGRSTS